MTGTVWRPSLPPIFSTTERQNHLRGRGDRVSKTHVNPPFHGGIGIANPSSSIPFSFYGQKNPMQKSARILVVQKNFIQGLWQNSVSQKFSTWGLA